MKNKQFKSKKEFEKFIAKCAIQALKDLKNKKLASSR
jgi:hypothetical protein